MYHYPPVCARCILLCQHVRGGDTGEGVEGGIGLCCQVLLRVRGCNGEREGEKTLSVSEILSWNCLGRIQYCHFGDLLDSHPMFVCTPT